MTSLALKNTATDFSSNKIVLPLPENYTFSIKTPTITIVGKRGVGKTELAKYLVRKFFPETPLLAVSDSHETNLAYNNLTQSCIDYETLLRDCDNIISTNDKLTIILDDFNEINNTIKKVFKKFFVDNRSKVQNTFNVIVICQILPAILKNIPDYIFICNTNCHSIKRSFYSHYPIFPTFELFNRTMESINKYDFLFVNLGNEDIYWLWANINLNDKYDLTFKYEAKKDCNNKKDILNHIKKLEEYLEDLKGKIEEL